MDLRAWLDLCERAENFIFSGAFDFVLFPDLLA